MKTIIIAEAGVNHNGSLLLAKKLIDVAVGADADYVKFQTFKAENIVSKDALMADYQQKNTGGEDHSQYKMLKRLELTPEQHIELQDYCREKKIGFLSTAFDLDSIDFLAHLKLDLWKIPSGEITNYPYLKRIAQHRQPVILSTGMCEMEDVGDVIKILTDNGLRREQITVLHCNTEYPTPMKDVNLRAMQAIADRFQVRVGYSDHTLGIEVPIAAVALGATVIEKHFTLDRNMEGPDHKASLEPEELRAMVAAIRNVEQALGSGEKKVTSSERKNRVSARKSIVASVAIKAGEIFTDRNLTTKRPGSGISPMRWDEIIGTKAIRNFQPDELIEL